MTAAAKAEPGGAPGITQSSRLAIERCTHDYSGVTVLRDVDFALRGGEIHALAGENGSGKSTLIRILTGALKPTSGTLTLDGTPISLSSPVEAQRRGIGVVHQEYQLFPDLTVAQCVFGVGKTPPRRRWSRTLDSARVEADVAALFDELGISVPAGALVRSLNAAECKFVEIARAMATNPRFLILDEATASFEPTAAGALLDLVRTLADRGVGICIISHRLDEVLETADRITVLRDGSRVGELHGEEATERRLIELIVGDGSKLERRETRKPRRSGAPLLRVPDAVAPGQPLELRAGEILGLTGLVGSGATQLVRGIGGCEPLRGPIELDGRMVRIRSPKDAGRLGIGFIPEDRKNSGVIAEQSVAVNMAMARLGQVCTRGVVRRAKLEALAEEYRESLDVRLPSIHAPVRTLSGGNQQKVMLARWLASGVRILAIDEPTHGVDIGARAQIHDLLSEFVGPDRAIVLATTDLHEALEVCDRIGVFRHGSLAALVTPEELRSESDDPEKALVQLTVGTGGGG